MKLVLELGSGSLQEQVASVSDPLAVTELSFLKSESIENVDGIGVFRNLRTLDLSGSDELRNLEGLRELRGLEHLDLSECTHLPNLVGLQGLEGMKTLDLTWCERLRDLTALRGLSSLQDLDLSFCRELRKLDGLGGLSGLQSLSLVECALGNLHGLQGLSGLQSLSVAVCKNLVTLHGLQGLSELRFLNLRDCTKLSDPAALQGLSKLESLSFGGCTQLASLDALHELWGLRNLDLSKCTRLSNLDVLHRFGELRDLDLSECTQLSSLDALRGLNRLQHLELSKCTQLINVSGLQELSELRHLDLSWCTQLRNLDALRRLSELQYLDLYGTHYVQNLENGALDRLSKLYELRADRLPAVPSEILSTKHEDNAAPRLAAWYRALRAGEAEREVKVYLLGNSRAGKSQIFNVLSDRPFVENAQSTHTPDLGRIPLLDADDKHPAVSGRVWDFGGQEIYHGTHALFLDPRAMFVIVWHPETDADQTYVEHGVTMRHRPLRYWLDFVRAVAGSDAPVIVTHSQTDRFDWPYERDRGGHGFKHFRQTWCSAKSSDLRHLRLELENAARELLHRNVAVRLPITWVGVREHLRTDEASAKTMTIERYREICEEQAVPAPDAVLRWLDRAGEVMYREGRFDDEIVLDVPWALEAVYALFDRKSKVFQRLQKQHGRFDLDWLDLIWSGKYTEEEQRLFLSLMERCAIAFEIGVGTGHYAAPDAMPEEGTEEVENRVRARLNGRRTLVRRRYSYIVLHEGVMRRLLRALGRKAGSDDFLWRYGAAFCVLEQELWAEVRTERPVREEGAGAQASADWAGSIIVTITGTVEKASSAEALAGELEKLVLDAGVGEKPTLTIERGPEDLRAAEAKADGAAQLVSKARPVPELDVWISYKSGDETDAGRYRQAVFQAVRNGLEERNYHVEYYERPEHQIVGNSIDVIAEKIAAAGNIVAIVDDDYLHSDHCMKEQLYAWRRAYLKLSKLMEGKMNVVLLVDVPLGDSEKFEAYRDDKVKHWKGAAESKEKNPNSTQVDRHDFYDIARDLAEWMNLLRRNIVVQAPRNFDETALAPLWRKFPQPTEDDATGNVPATSTPSAAPSQKRR